jgi:hypothetical protein
MTNPSDDELRAPFDALRREDGSRAPGFRAVLERERTIVSRRPFTDPLWIAAAAVIVLAVGIAVRESRQRDAARAATIASFDGSTPSITQWRSPTASLLRTPGTGVLAPPRIFSSILDGASRAAGQP